MSLWLVLVVGWIPAGLAAEPSRSVAEQAVVEGRWSDALRLATPQAKAGDVRAQAVLAQALEQGGTGKRDPDKALFWMRKAAEQGHPMMQFLLGLRYVDGLGVKKDITEAGQWFDRSAGQSKELRDRLYYTGRMAYNRGDFRVALVMLSASAEADSTHAQLLLGAMFERGDGVPVYPQEAVNWYRRAAEQGHPMAQFYLARHLDSGDGVTRDHQQAMDWYHKAADQGLAAAMFRLGNAYQKEGQDQDFEQAVLWFRKASEQDDPRAMFALAENYRYGEGVKKSRFLAVDWYYRAGHLYDEQGKKEDALAAMEEIDMLVPYHFLGKKLLAEIYTDDSKSQRSSGSLESAKVAYGTAWVTEQGYVVTASHVVEGHESIMLIRADGVQLKAEMALHDHGNDLALLKVNKPERLPPALRLSHEPARIGLGVYSAGYPEPELMGKRPKFTTGVVNALFGFRDDPRFLQVSVPTLSGNSGGPLLNIRGEVVGVVTSQLNAMKMFEATGDLPQNVNYAVKGSYLSVLLDFAPALYRVAPHSERWNDIQHLAKAVQGAVMTVVAK